MSTAERIIQELSGLRPERQSEVLDFIEFVKEKEKKKEEDLFFESSLSSAMRGMEDEDAIYSEADINEKFG
ncbi:MAG: hypothetical protein AB8B56_09055 [Crocinitomicaceae bacterium]